MSSLGWVLMSRTGGVGFTLVHNEVVEKAIGEGCSKMGRRLSEREVLPWVY